MKKMAQQTVQPILVHFGNLFLFCKILGLYPHDLQAFRRTHTLQSSRIGTFLVVVTMIVVVIFYNLLIYSFSEEDRDLKATQSTLTFVIGIFLTYIGLGMMLTDQCSALRNQSKIGELYERIRAVDENLLRENIFVDISATSKRIFIMIALTVVCELTILLSTYIMLVDHSEWISLLWIFSCFPTFYNSLDKIWFAMTLSALRQRFFMINSALEEMVESHERLQRWMENGADGSALKKPSFTNVPFDPSLEYLYKELTHMEPVKSFNYGKNRISPIAHSLNSFGEGFETPKKQPKQSSQPPPFNMVYESELNGDIQKVEEKLNNLCQLHDEICEIGKVLNELWSYPILVLMAYGFLIFTAQLYFLYCATQNQVIPSLFRSAKNAIITTIYLSYTAGKCIYLIYLSWKTSLESKRTGICLHKCGVVADNNLLYEIVNHLSLKLLNHSVDFSACGFFTLDMETLYGVSGGITSYLIILIQFNLAAQQAKDAIHNYDDESDSLVPTTAEGNTTTFLDFFTTTFMPTA
ncbi:PREDICTED: gustatory receptor for bitter taste 66a [Rhagoletis zephyria]|uniref:gustatory receptor for bitter taste 66a n=1 Tax=Rhagoletis zephyria TaxID=28612 RepID=UPI00081120EC|nr:PREDICTED: gustatory receptor for bitter taste 66a [Rhagoletis zephyria]